MRPEPASVQVARAWVADILTGIGRPELVESAELGVSELVTNAILHARPPLTLSVHGTVKHPRIEVLDHSPELLQLADPTQVQNDIPATYGRGLSLMAMSARQWGAEIDDDAAGKRVWFEPEADAHGGSDPSESYHGPAFRESSGPVEPPADSVAVLLLNLPAQLFGELRRYHSELRRELWLLALSDRERYPVSTRITDIFGTLDAEQGMTTGITRLDDAIENGLTTVDLEYAVPPSAPVTMGLLQTLLEELFRVFADEYLLAMAPREPLRSLQRWYFGEFVRQGSGETPLAWDGPMDHHVPARAQSGD